MKIRQNAGTSLELQTLLSESSEDWIISRSRVKKGGEAIMPKPEEIAWLAGIWDGEGSITVFKHREKNGCIKFCPTINVVNCNPVIINQIIKICDQIGVGLHINERDGLKENHAHKYELITRKFTTIKKFIEIVGPYLIGKKAQAELVLRFVDKRLEKMDKGISNQFNKYDIECEEIEKQIRSLNKKGPKPQRLNAELSERKEDIV